VAAFRLLGYEDRAIADQEFRDPRTDAGAIGAGHGVTALYAITLRGDAPDGRALGTIRLRWTEPDTSRETSLRQEIGSSVLAEDFGSTDPTLQLDAIVAAAAQVLRHDPAARGTDLRDVVDVMERSSDALPQTDQVHDFLEFLRKADELGG
jgi:Ca-activated chloride channel family protein